MCDRFNVCNQINFIFFYLFSVIHLNSNFYTSNDHLHTMLGDIFEHNRSKSYCFQIQPVTCYHRSDFFYQYEEYSINSECLK
jgi:hypothetical protein